MDYYEIWCNLRDTSKDLEFCRNVDAYLGRLRNSGKIAGYKVKRRKLGFGPLELGEFNITIEVENLAQLDRAFQTAATRGPDIEPFHRAVYSMVTDFRSALMRDFPDGGRMA